MAASVGMKSWMLRSLELGSARVRPLALMMPEVTVKVRFPPNGFPTASTHSPTRESSLSPNGAGVRLGASILSTARSVPGSVPTTLAGNSRRSSSRTVTWSEPSTTWSLVRMYPSFETMKPEPALSWKSGPCCGGRGKNCSKPGGTWNWGPSCWGRSVCPDLMNTTLGFTCSATEAKASLRSESAATLPAGAGLLVATAGELGCCADERWGRCRTPASSRPARNASPTLPDRARLNHPCDMSSSPRREPADGPGTWPGLTVQQMHGPARALHGRGNAAGSVTFENDGGAPGRPA